MEQEKQSTSKKLSPVSTVLLTITGTLLAIVVYRIIYFCITGS